MCVRVPVWVCVCVLEGRNLCFRQEKKNRNKTGAEKLMVIVGQIHSVGHTTEAYKNEGEPCQGSKSNPLTFTQQKKLMGKKD